ncbi:MAG: hypothetical protein BWY35_00845 [Firmicutes bacterium ADurb.Bin248]|nr:MAG: hypothetical protein BWY35_00845 [Firmicutes bacterium ADurb.Bin248]HOG01916.1 hypothetical protein [Clostridia bacterium]
MKKNKLKLLSLALAFAMLLPALPANLSLADSLPQELPPVAAIDFVNERLTGLVPGAVYVIGEAEYTAGKAAGLHPGTIKIVTGTGGWLGTTILIVKKGDGVATSNSIAQELSIPARPKKPAASLFTATYVSGGADGAIAGIAADMEYRLSSDDEYTQGTGADITGLAGGTYQIRYKAVIPVGETPGSFASGVTNVTVGVMSPEEIPAIAINFDQERLTGFTKNAAYVIDGVDQTMSATWIAIDDTWMGGAPVSIVRKGNGRTTTDSAAQSLTIPARPAKPTGIVATDEPYPGAGGTITGVTSAMEYRFSGGKWTPAGSMTGVAPGEYVFRFAATADAFHSAVTKVTLGTTPAAPEPAPEASIDYEAEKLTGLAAGARYDIGGADCTADSHGELAIDSAWFGTTLSIVKKGNGTTTADSGAQSLAVPARPAAPAGIGKTDETGLDLDDGAVTGATSAMEYQLSGAAAWTACPGGTITGLAPGTYLVRFKAAASAFASEAASVQVGAYAPVYSLSVTAPVFAPVTDGYAPVAAKPITIANTGNWQADIASVALGDTARFILGGSGPNVPKGGSISSWTVRPADNLPEGTYTTAITVTYNGGKTATAQVSFTVNSLYPQKTLSDYYSGVTVSGNINAYSELVVSKLALHQNCAACEAIRKALSNSAFQYIYGIEIRLTRGFVGDLTISIPVGAQYEGETVSIVCCSNGEYKTYTARVQFGRALFTVRSLSLFAVFVQSGRLTPPQTGGADFPWTALGVCLIALGAALPALVRRRRAKN